MTRCQWSSVRGARPWVFVGAAMVLAALVSVATAADEPVNLVKNGDAETGTTENWTNFTKVVSEGAHGGQHCFSRVGRTTILSKEPIPIDPEKTYVLTGWFKRTSKEPTYVYLGYRPLDEKKRQIAPVHVTALPGTETTLVEACKKDDTVLKVADASKWKTHKHRVVAFDIDDSGAFADLPNRNVTGYGITKLENKGDHWEIHLKKKCGRVYPAGTKIRCQSSGGTYIYNAAAYKDPGTEWKQFTGRIKGVAKQGAPSTAWWPGTKYAQILILANYGSKKGDEVLVDDISMTEAAE